MTTLRYLEPFADVEHDRARMLTAGARDHQIAKMLQAKRFYEAFKTANIKDSEVVINCELKEEAHPTVPNHMWEVMIWSLHFTKKEKAMLFKLAYSGDLLVKKDES